MSRIVSAVALLILVTTISALVLVQTSQAGASFTVTRSDDPTPNGCQAGDCSFREAVMAANTSGGTVDVPTGTNVVLTQGEVTITGEFDIVGGGMGSTSVSGNDSSRVLHVGDNADVYIEGLTIKNGMISDDCGGGILNDGNARLNMVAVTDNASEQKGGGVCNDGTMEIEDSEISDNSAHGGPAGGGILNMGTMTLTGSTVSGNTGIGMNGGGDGAGIANLEAATIEITYTLIENNTGMSSACDDCSSGAGIDNDGTLTLEYSFISENSGDAAAGLQNSGTATIRRSLFAGNEAGAILNSSNATMSITNSTISGNLGGPYPKAGVGGITNSGSINMQQVTIANNTGLQFSVGGVFNNTTGSVSYKGSVFSNNGTKNCNTAGTHISNGYNVFDDDNCATVGSDQVVGDAMLGPLQDNGGPTWTQLPLAGSPAINSGGPGCPSPDQRGAPRVGGCDAGAAEYGSIAPTPSPSPSPTPEPETYPQGDANCTDSITTGDMMEELLLAGGLSEPDDCGRTGGCVDVGGTCYPEWTDVNCDGLVDTRDALWIGLFLIGSPPDPPVDCPEIGTYPPVF